MNTTLQGKHTRKDYVRMLTAIRNTGRSGALKIEKGRFWRKLLFVDGMIAGYRSNIKEDQLQHSLVHAGLLTEKRLQWFLKHTGDQPLEDALLEAEAIEAGILEAHTRSLLDLGIGDVLRWQRGEWTFNCMPKKENSIDHSLLPQVDTMSLLWLGLKSNVSQADIFSEAGILREQLQLADQDGSLLPDLENTEIEDLIQESLESGMHMDELTKKVSAIDKDFYANGTLFKLIWLLHISGKLKQSEPYSELNHKLRNLRGSQQEQSSKEVETKTRARSRRRPRRKEAEEAPAQPMSSTELVLSEHKKRMHLNFYGFLSVPAETRYRKIDRICKRQMREWKMLQKDETLSKEAKEKLAELIRGVQLAYRTLTNPEMRGEYDVKLTKGAAQSISNAIFQSNQSDTRSQQKKSVGKVEKMMEAGRYNELLPYLEKQRQEDPSNPSILASLGWVRWNLKRNRKDAEEFLLLALTFDGRHLHALTYMAKISLASKDNEKARKFLRGILAVDRTSKWARQELSKIPNPK
jgi:hypothetical protein